MWWEKNRQTSWNVSRNWLVKIRWGRKEESRQKMSGGREAYKQSTMNNETRNDTITRRCCHKAVTSSHSPVNPQTLPEVWLLLLLMNAQKFLTHQKFPCGLFRFRNWACVPHVKIQTWRRISENCLNLDLSWQFVGTCSIHTCIVCGGLKLWWSLSGNGVST